MLGFRPIPQAPARSRWGCRRPNEMVQLAGNAEYFQGAGDGAGDRAPCAGKQRPAPVAGAGRYRRGVEPDPHRRRWHHRQ